MPPLLRFLIYRLLSFPITLFIITIILYSFIMLTPVEVRATLYYPKDFKSDRLTDEELQRYTNTLIKKYHLDDPFPVQYAIWATNLLRGNWGWSQELEEAVLPALLRRTAVSVELALYSMLVFIPLGLLSGVNAGAKKDSGADFRFRSSAFIGVAIPTFVLALVLISIFYVGLHWFPPERLGFNSSQVVEAESFHKYTGLITIDGLLNGKPMITLEALQHLALPVITLSLGFWGLLGRVARSSVIEEQHKEYVTAARAHGIGERSLVWKHIFRNALTPALTSSMLSTAALFTSVFVVEIIFGFRGVSSLIVTSSNYFNPDAPALLGFAVYSVVVVLFIMLVLDLLMALLDPRVREEVHGT
jgi:ABC-type dipeptide/oligopeptide/nickel transport system permease component